jgi:hypothetical protein
LLQFKSHNPAVPAAFLETLHRKRRISRRLRAFRLFRMGTSDRVLALQVSAPAADATRACRLSVSGHRRACLGGQSPLGYTCLDSGNFFALNRLQLETRRCRSCANMSGSP